jgi:hypothetical protein
MRTAGGTFLPRILLCAGVTGSAFGAVDENAVHLPFIDAHQQNPTVPAEKVNHVRAGVGHRRHSTRATEFRVFHESQLPLRMRHDRHLARRIEGSDPDRIRWRNDPSRSRLGKKTGAQASRENHTSAGHRWDKIR